MCCLGRCVFDAVLFCCLWCRCNQSLLDCVPVLTFFLFLHLLPFDHQLSVWRNQCSIFRMYTICSQHFFFFFYHAFQSTSKKGVWLYWLFLHLEVMLQYSIKIFLKNIAGSFRSFSLQWVEAFTEISSTADHLTKEVPIDDETISYCFSFF